VIFKQKLAISEKITKNETMKKGWYFERDKNAEIPGVYGKIIPFRPKMLG
jgi:hypothetical protein